MSKKKFFAILLTCAMAVSVLAGCGSGETPASTPAAGGEPKDSAYKIALIQQHQTNAFQIAITEAAEAKASELGVELTVLSADQDAAAQISQIEQCVSEGFNAILFEPVDPDGLRDAAKSAADAGVIVVNIVSVCTDWESAGISIVSYGDNVKAGENEMQHVADLLGGKGNVAILTLWAVWRVMRMSWRTIPIWFRWSLPPIASGIPLRRRPPWRAGCPLMIWTPSYARTTAWPSAPETRQAPTAAL